MGVEKMFGDSGWLCPGEKGWKPNPKKKVPKKKESYAACEKRFLAILAQANELCRKLLVPVRKKRKKR